jgi:hypothetical protein
LGAAMITSGLSDAVAGKSRRPRLCDRE